MFDRFTDRAKRSLSAARQAAIELRHPAIAPEHLLLGLLQGDGVAPNVIRGLGIDLDALRRAVLAAGRTGAIGTLHREEHGRLPFTLAAKRVLEAALAEAQNLGHAYLGTEHLLLALVRTEGTVAAQALADTRAHLAVLRPAILAFLGPDDNVLTSEYSWTSDLDRSRVRALLIGTSTMGGSGCLRHGAREIFDFLGPRTNVLFVPYALADHDGCSVLAHAAIAALGHTLTPLHACKDMTKAVLDAEAILVGGGSAVRLLKALHDFDPFGMVRRRILQGMPYIGVGAGSQVASLSIRMPRNEALPQAPKLPTLELVPFRIARRRAFHGELAPMLELPDGGILRIEGHRAELLGGTPARWFSPGQPPRELAPLSDVSFLLHVTT